MSSGLGAFIVSEPRKYPVILLLDTSGSMSEGGKIQALNMAVRDMLAGFLTGRGGDLVIHCCVIAFGNNRAEVHMPLQPVADVVRQWRDVGAEGNTPLGAALQLTVSLVEDRDLIPARSWQPTIILVSDGIPNDEWKDPLEKLIKSDRASKASRFAVAIGTDADEGMLERFKSEDGRVLHAADAAGIEKWFKWVTMTTVAHIEMKSSGFTHSVERVDDIDVLF